MKVELTVMIQPVYKVDSSPSYSLDTSGLGIYRELYVLILLIFYVLTYFWWVLVQTDYILIPLFTMYNIAQALLHIIEKLSRHQNEQEVMFR